MEHELKPSASQLLFLWIKCTDYRCFSNAGFNFSPDYFFAFENQILRGDKSDSINVFSSCKSIANITAIVGKNGAGKSTLLNFILSLQRGRYLRANSDEPGVTIGISDDKSYYVAVYLASGKIVVVNCSGAGSIRCAGNVFEEQVVPEGKISAAMTTIYLSLDYKTTASFNSFGKSSRIIPLTPRQIENDGKAFYAKKLYEDLKQSIKTGNQDMDMFLITDYYVNHRSVLEHDDPYIDIAFKSADYSDGILNYLESGNAGYYPSAGRFSLPLLAFEEELRLLAPNRFFQPSLFDLNKADTLEAAMDCLSDMLKTIDGESLLQRIPYLRHAKKELVTFLKIVSKKDVLAGPVKKGVCANYRVSATDLKPLLRQIKEPGPSFILKYLSFDYRKSDGELARLRHNAYLHYAMNAASYSMEDRYKITDSLLVLLDEVDIHLHPEWQRCLINDLVKEASNIFRNRSVQYIMTTHSPIVLSDLPQKNVLYLSTDKDGNRIAVKKDISTFGANIHNLYNDSFFFDGGSTIGEYAANYVDSLYKKIQSGEIDAELAKKEIDLIGEPLLRNELSKRLKRNQNSESPLSEKEETSVRLAELMKEMSRLSSLIRKLLKESN